MFVTKLWPQICTYIVICPETGVGIIWGSHGSAQEAVPVNPLFCNTLALHGAYIGWPMNCPCKAIVLPPIGITWGLH